MIKKILAALIAATMCAGLAACGDNNEGKNTAETTTTTSAATTAEVKEAPAETDADDKADESSSTGSKDKAAADEKAEAGGVSAVTEVSSSAAGNDSSSSDSSEKDDEVVITDNMIKADGATLKLSKKELLTMLESDLEAEPTEEEIFAAIEAAIAQYRAAESRDLDAFLKTFRFGDLAEPTADMVREILKRPDNNKFQSYLEETGQETKFDILDDLTTFIEGILSDEAIDKLDAATQRSDAADELRKLITEAYNGISASSEAVKESVEYDTVFDSEENIEPLDGIDDGTVYLVQVDRCAREKKAAGDDLYMSFSLIMLTKDKQYELDDVIVWRINGKYGVYITDTLYADEADDEIKGKNAKEIFELLKKEQFERADSEKDGQEKQSDKKTDVSQTDVSKTD